MESEDGRKSSRATNGNGFQQRSPVVLVRQLRLLPLKFSVPVSEPEELSSSSPVQTPRPSHHLNQTKSNQ